MLRRHALYPMSYRRKSGPAVMAAGHDGASYRTATGGLDPHATLVGDVVWPERLRRRTGDEAERLLPGER
jgi:hypothetical protein